MSWDKIPGWMAFEQTYDEAVAKAPQQGARILEIGTAFGRSAAYMGTKILESGKSIDFACVDPWDWGGWHGDQPDLLAKHKTPMKAFLACMKEHAPKVLDAKWFTAHAMTSARACELMGGSWDFIFIDGDHSYEAVRQDIALWAPRVRPGGMIGGDDYHEKEYPGVVQAVHEAFGRDVEIREARHWRHWLHRVGVAT